VVENRWFANTAEMTKRYAANPNATNSKPNLDGMAFATVPPTGGKDGHEFTMQFSFAIWGSGNTTPLPKSICAGSNP
jgi:hypothetical protein